MSAQIQQLLPSLDRIVREISNLSTRMVTDAREVGALLNEAREQFTNEREWGRWRAEQIEPLGISARTARRMQGLATTYPTKESLPKGVNLSTLYLLVSQSTNDRTHAALTLALEAQPDMPYREAERIVAGANHDQRREKKDRGLDPELARHAPKPKVELPEKKAGADPDMEWAANLVRALGAKSDRKRMQRLNALLWQLRKRGMLVVDPEVTVGASKTGRIEVTV